MGLLIGWLSDVNGSAAAPTLKRCLSASVSDDSINSLEPLGFLQRLLALPRLHRTPNVPVVEGAPSADGGRAVALYRLGSRSAVKCYSTAEAPALS